jgi:hypothetical protein
MFFQSHHQEGYSNNDLNQKLRDKTAQLVDLQRSYQSALETIGRMAVHANNLEKEKNMFAERYKMLVETNRWNSKSGIRNCLPNTLQRESNNFQDFTETGPIKRQTNAYYPEHDTSDHFDESMDVDDERVYMDTVASSVNDELLLKQKKRKE